MICNIQIIPYLYAIINNTLNKIYIWMQVFHFTRPTVMNCTRWYGIFSTGKYHIKEDRDTPQKLISLLCGLLHHITTIIQSPTGLPNFSYYIWYSCHGHGSIWDWSLYPYPSCTRVNAFLLRTALKCHRVHSFGSAIVPLFNGRCGTAKLLIWWSLSHPGAPFTNMPSWISKYIHYKLWDEIPYPFINFNGATVEDG